MVTIDTVATAPTDADMIHNRKFDTGFSTDDGITAYTRPVITGAGAEKNATITITDQFDNVIGTTKAKSNGTWKFIPTADLADGDYELTAMQTDVAGNESALSDPVIITIDTTAPDAPLAPDLDSASDDGAADDDNVTSLRNLTFNGTAEANAWIQLFRDGKRIGDAVQAAGDGTWSITLLDLKSGPSDWAIVQTDLAGNESAVGEALTVTITE
jgi:hypothetical protein